MDLEKLLKDLQVLQEGHFLLKSGLHSKYYFQKFRILENPGATNRLCALVADRYRDRQVEWVIGPTTGGVIIAFETARLLGCRAGFAEEKEGKRVVARGFEIAGKNVLIVDDVLTTGKSVKETIAAVNEGRGRIAGVAVLIDRSAADPGFEFWGVYRKEVENFPPDQCPLCKADIPLQQLGGPRK
jgi:orotate phosphoribosyltransferase